MLNWLSTSRILWFQKLNHFQPNVLHILHHFFLAIVYLICDSFFFSLVTNLKCKGGKLAYIRLHRNLSDMVDRIWVQWNLVGKHIGLQANKRHQSIFSNRIPEELQFQVLPPPPFNSFFFLFFLTKYNFSSLPDWDSQELPFSPQSHLFWQFVPYRPTSQIDSHWTPRK